jgi:hypothetical protein
VIKTWIQFRGSGIEDYPDFPTLVGFMDVHLVESDGLDGDPLDMACEIEGFAVTDGLELEELLVDLKVECGEDYQVDLVEV